MSQFIIESRQRIFEQDFINLRKLYSPIIGPLATALYQYLIDSCKTNYYKTDYKPMKLILSSLHMSNDDLLSARKTLEAVGLLQTFTKHDDNIFLLSVFSPLSIDKFSKNKILWNRLLHTIGEVELERIVYEFKTVTMDKKEFVEISAKYHDIYEINEENVIANTSEILVPKFANKDQAVKNSTCEIFVRFLTQEKPSPSLLRVFQNFRNQGMSNTSLNLIVDYSYSVNNRIVAKHVEKIAQNLFESDVTSANDIKKELNNAFKKRNPSQVNITEKGGVEPSLDEVFSDLFS